MAPSFSRTGWHSRLVLRRADSIGVLPKRLNTPGVAQWREGRKLCPAGRAPGFCKTDATGPGATVSLGHFLPSLRRASTINLWTFTLRREARLSASPQLNRMFGESRSRACFEGSERNNSFRLSRRRPIYLPFKSDLS